MQLSDPGVGGGKDGNSRWHGKRRGEKIGQQHFFGVGSAFPGHKHRLGNMRSQIN